MAFLNSPENILQGKETLNRESVDNHVLDLNWHLQKFSNIPKYICSSQYYLALGCKLLWRIEVTFYPSDTYEKSVKMLAKLHRVDCDVGTVRANFRVMLRNNRNKLLHEGLCSSMFASDSIINPVCMSVTLKNPLVCSLPDDELNLRIVLKTDDCCSEINPPQNIRLSSSGNLNLRRTKLIDDLQDAYRLGLMADVLLTIGEHSIPANKFVLCARSPVLKRILENESLADIGCELDATGCDLDSTSEFNCAFRLFISYLYTGLLDEVSTDVACTLYSMATKYEVRCLQMTCGHILLSRIDIQNACKILKLANLHKDVFVKDSASRFIYKHYSEIAVSKDWGRLIERDSVLHSEILDFCASQAFINREAR